MASLGAGDLSPKDLIQMIQSHPWPGDALIMAFTLVEARLERFAFDEPFLLATEQGRIFCPAGELRWRRVADDFRTIYLGEPPMPSLLSEYRDELYGLKDIERTVMLWGLRTDTQNEWLEQEVPHRFKYPIDTTPIHRGRVVLKIEDWVDRADIPLFSRYHSLMEIEGEK